MRQSIIIAATIVLIIALFGSAAADSNSTMSVTRTGDLLASVDNDPKIAPQVQTELGAANAGDMMTVIVTLVEQEDVGKIVRGNRAAQQRAVIQALRAKANASQRSIVGLLQARMAQGSVSAFEPFWVLNGLSVTATADVVNELAARSDVRSITADEISIVPVASTTYNPPEANLTAINAPALLDLGFAGQGVVVANMDSGVDITHPDLAPRWRGGSNSWFDPYNQHPTTPTDLTGHGTWTMGVMVGGDSGGTLIGVAPQAQWIAVKIFNDAGNATATAIHQGFQWLLDPDGNPNTADAPQVVNNSWTDINPDCNLQFQLDLRALIAIGIVPVFAAGNFGPSTSSTSPANYPEALAVGAVSNGNQIYNSSSRGPSGCGETSTVYPEIVAPGINIRTSDLLGLYKNATGTSLAAPHVSGALALLLSAYPELMADRQKLALLSTAVDLGPAGPDNTYGYGRLDVLAAYQMIASGGTGNPTPTPIPTATATPNPAIFIDGFESGNLSAWTAVADTENDLAVTTGAAMVGSKGLAALIDNRTAMYVQDDSPANESSYQVHFYFDPNSISMKSGDTHRILAAGNGSAETVGLDFRYSSGAYQIQASTLNDNGSSMTTSWYTISDAPHAVDFDWQAATSAGANNGLLALRIDSTLQQTLSGLDNDTHRIETVSMGPLSGIDSRTSGTEFFDDFVSNHLTTTPPTPVPPTPVSPTPTSIPPTPTAVANDLIFGDGFESGNLGAWTAVVDQENDIAVTSGAALVGSNGLAALIDNKTAMYVRDDSPLNESRYRVRFYFDPNSISMGSGNTHRILAALNSSAETIRLDFRYSGGAYQIQAGVRTDGGGYVTTSWFTISDAPHAIEFDWQAATSVGANNGYLSLWIDNNLQQTKGGLDNDTMRVNEVRLGPLAGLDNGTSGTEFFDDFISHRVNPIGL